MSLRDTNRISNLRSRESNSYTSRVLERKVKETFLSTAEGCQYSIVSYTDIEQFLLAIYS